MFFSHQKNTKGFTLIELLIVVAIIGILTSVMIVSLASARIRAQHVKFAEELKDFTTGLKQYFLDGNELPRCTPAMGPSCGQNDQSLAGAQQLEQLLQPVITKGYVRGLPRHALWKGSNPLVFTYYEPSHYAPDFTNPAEISCGDFITSQWNLAKKEHQGILLIFNQTNVPIPGLSSRVTSCTTQIGGPSCSSYDFENGCMELLK